MKKNNQNVPARFALQTFGTAFIILFPPTDKDKLLSGTVPSRTKESLNNILIWFLCLFRNKILLVTLHGKTKFFVPQREYCALDAWTSLEDFDSRICQDLWKFFVQLKCTRAHCVPTIHVPRQFDIAIVIPTIRGECTAHRSCSQIFHTCWQRNLGSCKRGEFCDG